MRYIKRIIAVVLVLLTVFAVSCKSQEETPAVPPVTQNNSPAKTTTLTIFYNAKDSLNPYAMTSEHNIRLQTLLYDPLVAIDQNFQPQFVIADSVDVVEKVCTVTLKDVFFSDGSVLTADDVVYSMKLAMESESNYALQLTNIKSYSATDSKTVTIELKSYDPYFANLLTFPIIKAKSELRTDENKIVLEPIGSGRFIFDRDAKHLKANKNHISGAFSLETIQLIDAPDQEVVNFNLESDYINIYYSNLNDGNMPSMNGSVSRSPLNNLIYLGVNLDSTWLSSAEMRYAVSYAIDRTAVVEKAYYSYAMAATGLFHPLWEDAKGIQNLNSTANLQNSIANLNDLGYNNKDKEGFFVNSKGKRITLKLICNEENSRRVAAATLIEKQIEAAGLNVELKIMPWEQYKRALSGGDFDLYIAEVSLFNNMDVTELVTSTGSLSYGIPNIVKQEKPDNVTDDKADDKADDAVTDGTVDDAEPEFLPNETVDIAVKGFYQGTSSLTDIINAFNAEMPIIPICYRSGITVANSNITSENMSSVTDAYYNITNTNSK